MSTTPFEDSGRAVLTTQTQEVAFANALVAAHPTRVTKTVFGQSVQGRDLYALRFGNQYSAKPPVMITFGVHGDEEIPPEAALTLARDLCENPQNVPFGALLGDRQLWLIPDVNPDNRIKLRNNANNVDITRVFFTAPATSPETRALVDLINDIDPVAVMDCHEWLGYTHESVSTTFNQFTSSDRGVRAASIQACVAMREAAVASGWAAMEYPRPTPTGSIFHYTGELGIISCVIETQSPWDKVAINRGTRHDQQRVMINAWLKHVSDNRAAFESLRAAARAHMASKVSKTNYVWPLTTQHELHNSIPVYVGIEVSATSYTLNPTQLAAAKPAMDRHRVIYDESTGIVTMAQERASVAALLLDPLADPGTRVVDGATRNAPPAIAAPVLAPAPEPDRDLDVIGAVTW